MFSTAEDGAVTLDTDGEVVEMRTSSGRMVSSAGPAAQRRARQQRSRGVVVCPAPFTDRSRIGAAPPRSRKNGGSGLMICDRAVRQLRAGRLRSPFRFDASRASRRSPPPRRPSAARGREVCSVSLPTSLASFSRGGAGWSWPWSEPTQCDRNAIGAIDRVAFHPCDPPSRVELTVGPRST